MAAKFNLPQITDSTTEFLRHDGAWAVPGGGAFQIAQYTFTQQQLINMGTGGVIEIMPAPGAGLIISPVSATALFMISDPPLINNVFTFDFFYTSLLGIKISDGILAVNASITDGGVGFCYFDAIPYSGRNYQLVNQPLIATSHDRPRYYTFPVFQDSLASISVNDGGTGYSVGDTGTIDGGDNFAIYIVTSVNAGVVTGIALLDIGSGYTDGTAITTNPIGGGPQPGGNGDLTVDVVANTDPTTGNGPINVATISEPGTGYSVGDVLQISQIANTTATITVNSVGGSGEIQDFTLTDPGTGYHTDVDNTLLGGGGTNGQIDVVVYDDGFIPGSVLLTIGYYLVNTA